MPAKRGLQPAPDDKRCTATTRAGQPCKNYASHNGLCRIHLAPDKAVEHLLNPGERRCTATATGGTTRPERKGEPCGEWAMQGQYVCHKHGGKAPQNLAAAHRRIVEDELNAQARRLVGKPVDNPLTELAALAGRSRAWMELIQDRVELLLSATGAAEASPDGGDIRYRAGAGEQLRAEVALYERAMDRLGKFLADYGRLGIDERLAKITETQAEKVISAIDAALAHAGITGSAAAEARQVAARRLRAV